MSGGSFNYAFRRVEEFTDELEEKLREAATGAQDPRDSYQLEPETTARLHEIAKLTRHVAALMKEVEWLYSGDTGDESFARRVDALPRVVFKNNPPLENS